METTTLTSIGDKLAIPVQLGAADLYRVSLTVLFRRFKWFLAIISFGLFVVVTLNVLAGQWEWNWQSLLGPFFILSVYAVFVAPYCSARKYLAKNAHLGKEIIYVLSDDGIDVSAAHSHTRRTWGAILEARETPIHFLVYPQTALANIIPKRCLTGADQEEDFDT